jgi:hypothetical protein
MSCRPIRQTAQKSEMLARFSTKSWLWQFHAQDITWG